MNCVLACSPPFSCARQLPDSLRNPSQFPCTLFWKREDQLLIGWGYNVFEVQINNSTREDQELRKAPPRHGKIRKESALFSFLLLCQTLKKKESSKKDGK